MAEKARTEETESETESPLREREMKELENNLATQLIFSDSYIGKHNFPPRPRYRRIKQRAQKYGVLEEELDIEDVKVLVFKDGTGIKRFKGDLEHGFYQLNREIVDYMKRQVEK